jgi:hypothetical protein
VRPHAIHRTSIRRGMVTVVGLLYALAWAAGSSADVAKGSAWSRGLALYKQSKFAAACPLLTEAAAIAAENGAIWADLGLCELKRGDRAASIHASLLAARFGDERVRKNAYFNLHLAGYEAGVHPAPGALAEPAELACSMPAFACTGDWTAYGSRSGTSGTVAIFDTNEEDARARCDDLAGALGGETGPGEVPLSESQLCFDTWCELNAWRCEESGQVSRRAEACFQKALGALPADLCSQDSAACETFRRCHKAACAAAEDAIDRTPGAKPWPAVVREHDEDTASCYGNCVEGDLLSCTVVVVDPCQNRIGYVCSEPDAKGKRDRVHAGEVPFFAR